MTTTPGTATAGEARDEDVGVVVERPRDGVGLVRIDRPAKRNALSVPVRRALLHALQAFDADPQVRAIVLAGSAKVFAAGADLAELEQADAIDMMLQARGEFWSALGRLGTPLVASVRGVCFGGGFELALHADLIVAGRSARFGLPEIRVGLMPGAGGTQRLLRLVGRHRTLMMLLTGEPMSADEALAAGVVNRVLDDDAVDAAALELAAGLAQMPPLAVRQIREVVAAGADAPLETALLLERKALLLLCASEDKREGIRAFFEKRPPKFVGR